MIAAKVISSFLIGKGISEIIKRTALATVFSAIALPMTVYKSAAKALDNDFQQSTDRATKAGIILADVLEKGVQGNRPTILVLPFVTAAIAADDFARSEAPLERLLS